MASNKWVQDLKKRIHEKKSELRQTHTGWVTLRRELEACTSKWTGAKTTSDRDHWYQMREDIRGRLREHQERMDQLEADRTEAIESLMDTPKEEKEKRVRGRRRSPEAVLEVARMAGDAVELSIRLVSGDVLRVTTRGQERIVNLFNDMVEQHHYNPAVKTRMDFLVEEKEEFQPLMRMMTETWSERFSNKEYPVIHLLIQPEAESETKNRRPLLERELYIQRLCPVTSMEDVEEAAKAWWVMFRPKWDMKRETYIPHFVETHPHMFRPWSPEEFDVKKEEERAIRELDRSYHRTCRKIEDMMAIVMRRMGDGRLLENIERNPLLLATRELVLVAVREGIAEDPSCAWMMENNGLLWNQYLNYMTIEEMMDAGMSYERVLGPDSGMYNSYAKKLHDHRVELDQLIEMYGHGVMAHLRKWSTDTVEELHNFTAVNSIVLFNELPDTL